MKIFLISNTNFGHKNHDDFIDYFTKSFIPFIKKFAKPDDILIHSGNLFNSKSFNINVINDVYNIFLELSGILKVKFIRGNNDIGKTGDSFVIFNNIKDIEVLNEFELEDFVVYNSKEDRENGYNGYYRNFTKKRIGSPYQIDDMDKGKKKGFLVYDVDSKKILFQENKFSKKFIKYKIDTEEDLDELKSDMFKDKVHIEINKELYENNENKINVILSKYNISKVSYYNIESEDEYNEKDSVIDIEYNLRKEISKTENSELIMKAFDNIIGLYDKKYN